MKGLPTKNTYSALYVYIYIYIYIKYIYISISLSLSLSLSCFAEIGLIGARETRETVTWDVKFAGCAPHIAGFWMKGSRFMVR